MKLFLLRHGNAESHASTDSMRKLSKQGIQEVTKITNYLVANNIIFDKIVSSGYERANRTAGLIAGLEGNNFDIDARLEPNSEVKDLENVVLKYSNCKKLLLVFHQPIIQKFCNHICGNWATDKYSSMFPTATLVSINLFSLSPSMSGFLETVITPDKI